jgi:small-conductance mechanosensitive channel
MSLMGTILQIIVSVIIISPILWLVGRSMVGGAKAKFTDAIWIVVLGIIINVILGTFVHGTIGFIVTLIVWIALIKHFFDAGWGKGILIGIIAIIVLIVIAFVLAFLGIVAIAGLAGLGGLGGLSGLGGY